MRRGIRCKVAQAPRNLASRNVATALNPAMFQNLAPRQIRIFYCAQICIHVLQMFLKVRSPEGYLLVQSKSFFFFNRAEIFRVRFRPLGVRNFNKKFRVCSEMCSVRTEMCMYAKVTDRFSPNFVYRFVWVAGSSCRNLFSRRKQFFRFSTNPILDQKKQHKSVCT